MFGGISLSIQSFCYIFVVRYRFGDFLARRSYVRMLEKFEIHPSSTLGASRAIISPRPNWISISFSPHTHPAPPTSRWQTYMCAACRNAMLTNSLALAPFLSPMLEMAILSDVMARPPRNRPLTYQDSFNVTSYKSNPAFYEPRGWRLDACLHHGKHIILRLLWMDERTKCVA